MTDKLEIIPLDENLLLLVNRILDQNQQLIEFNNRILSENARILTLLEFPKFITNPTTLSEAAKYFRK